MRVLRDILKLKVNLICLVDGMCHNWGTIKLIFFHASNHFEQFGGVLFYFVKLNILMHG